MQRSTDYVCRVLIGTQSPLLLWRLGYRPTIWVLVNKGIYKFLGGVFSGNTCEEYARVHMVCFGSDIYQQYVYGVI